MKNKIAVSVLTAVILLLQMPSVFAGEGQKNEKTSEAAQVDCYGDPLPTGAISRLGTSRLRHAGSYLAPGGAQEVFFSPSGKELYTVGLGSPLRLWDATTGKQLKQFDSAKWQPPSPYGVHKGRSAYLSEDGGTFVIHADDRLEVWDTTTGKLKGQRNFSGSAIAVSPKGEAVTLIEGDASAAQHVTWEVATDKAQSKPIELKGANFVLSPDAKTLVSIDNPEGVTTYLMFWDLATGKKRFEVECDLFYHIWVTAFSADGRYLALSGRDYPMLGGRVDGIAYVYDLTTGKEVAQIGEDKVGTYAIAFSPDNKLLATGSGAGTVRIWDVVTGKLVSECQNYRSHVTSLSFSPDSKRLASGARYLDHTARVWDVASGRELTDSTQGHVGPIVSLAYMPDGKGIVSGGRDGLVGLWNPQSGKLQHPLFRAGEIEAVATPSGDGKTIVTIGSTFVRDKKGLGKLLQTMGVPTTVRTWDATTGKEVSSFPGPLGLPQTLTVSSDGKTGTTVLKEGLKNREVLGVVYQYSPKQIPYLLDFDARKAHVLSPPAPSKSVKFFSDQKFVAAHEFLVRIENQQMKSSHLSVWDVQKGTKVAETQGPINHSLSCQAISPEGRLIATSGIFPGGDNAADEWETGKSAIQVWSPSSPKESFMLKDYDGVVTALAFSPDSKLLAAAIREEETIVLWNTETGKECGSFTGYDVEVWCLAFSPDGRQLASGNNDSTILVWELPAQENN